MAAWDARKPVILLACPLSAKGKKAEEYMPTTCMNCKRLNTTPVKYLLLDVALMKRVGGGKVMVKKEVPLCGIREEEQATKYCNIATVATRTPTNLLRPLQRSDPGAPRCSTCARGWRWRTRCCTATTDVLDPR